MHQLLELQQQKLPSAALRATFPFLLGMPSGMRALPLEVFSLATRPLATPATLSRLSPLLPPGRRTFSSSRRTLNRSTSPSASWLPIPFVTETSGSTHHTTDLFSRLLKERIVAVYGEVDERMAATVTASLLFLEADAPEKPINLYINSPGGSVSAGLAIYDTLQYITPEITTICLGQAASMGSLLLAGGSPGKRFCLPHSSVMLHQPSGGYHGTAADIAIHAKEILRVREQLNKIYERHLTPKKDGGRKLTLTEIEGMMERDYFLSADEALELGVVDEILGSRKAVKEKTES